MHRILSAQSFASAAPHAQRASGCGKGDSEGAAAVPFFAFGFGLRIGLAFFGGTDG
jgi:hypothetical protein